VEVALLFYQVALLILTVLTVKHRYIFTTKFPFFQTAIVKGRNRNSYDEMFEA
jgi:hypothetical protein